MSWKSGTSHTYAARQTFHAPDSRHVIFTPGITYSLNYLIKGLLRPGDHVLVSSLEHNAVMRPLCQLTSQDIHYTMIPAETEWYNAPGICRSTDSPGDKSSHHASCFQCMRNHSADPGDW